LVDWLRIWNNKVMNKAYRGYRKFGLLAGSALLALIAGVAAGWMTEQISAPQPPRLASATALLNQTKPLPVFSLVDDKGHTFNNARLAGHWSFLFFGYTHCPDVCPTTLSILNKAMRSIARQGDAANTQVVFVSIDPQRDTPNTLKGYLHYFNPKFVGVTGRPAAVNALTSALGIPHARIADPSGHGNYLVDHSASILLIGPQGKLVALFSAPQKAPLLASDFHKLRSYYENS
jgi:protein SCO1/2